MSCAERISETLLSNAATFDSTPLALNSMPAFEVKSQFYAFELVVDDGAGGPYYDSITSVTRLYASVDGVDFVDVSARYASLLSALDASGSAAPGYPIGPLRKLDYADFTAFPGKFAKFNFVASNPSSDARASIKLARW